MAASSPLHSDGGVRIAPEAAIACTASLHRTPPFQATNTKALLVLSGRGAAVALVAPGFALNPLSDRTLPDLTCLSISRVPEIF